MIFDSGNGTWSSRSTTLMKVKDEHKERKKKENECTYIKKAVPIKLSNMLKDVYKFVSKVYVERKKNFQNWWIQWFHFIV